MDEGALHVPDVQDDAVVAPTSLPSSAEHATIDFGSFGAASDAAAQTWEGLQLGQSIDLDGMPWPWLHESMFLQDDPLIVSPVQPSLDAHLELDPPMSWDDESRVAAAADPMGNGTSNSSNAAAQLDPLPGTLDAHSVLVEEVDKLVETATRTATDNSQLCGGFSPRSTPSLRLSSLLGKHDVSIESHDDNELDHAVTRYFRDFNALWPMFSLADYDRTTIHPVLYLVQVSIGSMYGSALQRQFGTLLHKRLRRLLGASLFDLEGPDTILLWLAQARLLTQVHGLYFGQQQCFSYAQHLGAILIAQCRRMDLFQENYVGYPTSMQQAFERHNPDQWRKNETRRRLAFGVLRGDVYTSVLLNTRPLLSYEEVDLRLPCSDDLWHNRENFTAEQQSLAYRMEEKHQHGAGFSDLVRIYLDRAEPMSELPSGGYELCLFGLQSCIWKSTRDRMALARLTDHAIEESPHGSSLRPPSTASGVIGNQDVVPAEGNTGSRISLNCLNGQCDQRVDIDLDPLSQDCDTLGQSLRRMQDLRSDGDRIRKALERWHSDFMTARRSSRLTQSRDTLMSCTILWHLSELQMLAPLDQLHAVSYRVAEHSSLDVPALQEVRKWAATKEATMAAKRATLMCELVSYELSRPEETRAKFNFTAFAGLHHATVVLWITAEIGPCSEDVADHAQSRGYQFRRLLHARDSKALLQTCSRMFYRLSLIGGASFGSAAARLSGCKFPAMGIDPR